MTTMFMKIATKSVGSVLGRNINSYYYFLSDSFATPLNGWKSMEITKMIGQGFRSSSQVDNRDYDGHKQMDCKGEDKNAHIKKELMNMDEEDLEELGCDVSMGCCCTTKKPKDHTVEAKKETETVNDHVCPRVGI